MQRVCQPAGIDSTGYLRSDELPADAASGYLGRTVPRTNVLHLPVLGSGDGGIYTTAADMTRSGGTVRRRASSLRKRSPRWSEPRSQAEEEADRRYGLGFWLDARWDLLLEGYDAGVSFLSDHDPHTGRTQTVISNTSEGAWPVMELPGRVA